MSVAISRMSGRGLMRASSARSCGCESGTAPYFRAASVAGAAGPTFSNTQKAQLLPLP